MFPALLGCWHWNDVRHKIVELLFKNIWDYAPSREGCRITIIITKLRSNVLRYVVQSLSHVQIFVIPWTAACQASLSFTISWSLLKLMSIESVMLSNHLMPCCPVLLLPSIFPSLFLGLEWKLTVSSYWDLMMCQLPCKMLYKHHFTYSSQLCEVGIIITFYRQTKFRGIK